MLITTPAAKGDIVGFKLVNGEEVIGRLEESNADTLVVSKPIQTQQVQGPDGNPAIAFGVFLAAVPEDRIVFRKGGLITEAMRVREEVKTSYTKLTTSLALPDTGLIV